MFRFTTRELLLLTVIVALALGWCVDRANNAWRVRSVRRYAIAVRDALENAEQNYYSLREEYESEDVDKWAEIENDLAAVDWGLAAQMVP